MNIPRNEETKSDTKVVKFADDVFEVLWTKHKKLFDKSVNIHVEILNNLRDVVKDISKWIDYDYNDILDYKKRILYDNNIIEAAKEKLRNHEKLKQILEELKSIPWKSKGIEMKIWSDVLWDLIFESVDVVWVNIPEYCIFGKEIKVLKKTISELPKDSQILDLRNNRLWKQTVEEIKEVMDILPNTLKNLDLSWNFLWEMDKEDLKNIISGLSKNIIIINLENNKLWEQTVEGQKEVMSALPEDLKILELWWNGLWRKTNVELNELLSILPKGLKILSLWRSDISIRSIVELKELISVLPKGLKSLNLSENNIWVDEDIIIEYSESIWIGIMV